MTTWHMALDIRGALSNWTRRDFRGFRDNGRLLSPDEAKRGLIEELAKGNLFLPMGECDGFDPKKGCPGHVIPSQQEQQEAHAKAEG